MELRTIRIIGMIDGVVLLFYFIWCLVNLKLPYEKIFKRFSPHDNSFFFVVCQLCCVASIAFIYGVTKIKKSIVLLCLTWFTPILVLSTMYHFSWLNLIFVVLLAALVGLYIVAFKQFSLTTGSDHEQTHQPNGMTCEYSSSGYVMSNRAVQNVRNANVDQNVGDRRLSNCYEEKERIPFKHRVVRWIGIAEGIVQLCYWAWLLEDTHHKSGIGFLLFIPLCFINGLISILWIYGIFKMNEFILFFSTMWFTLIFLISCMGFVGYYTISMVMLFVLYIVAFMLFTSWNKLNCANTHQPNTSNIELLDHEYNRTRRCDVELPIGGAYAPSAPTIDEIQNN